jgi:iron complex transport system substrate-binding protein
MHSPQRIVCLQPSATVILGGVGELDRVVACTRYCADVVPGIANGARQILADSWTANADQITAARPDLVIAAVPYQEKAVSEILRAGSRFLGLAPRCLSDIYMDIAAISAIVDAGERGQQMIASMKARIEEVRTRTVGQPRLRVFCEEWGKPIIASQTWVAELIDAAGGDFLGTPGKKLTAKEIQSLDPEVSFAAWCGAGDRVPLEKIISDRSWQDTSAARSGRVYCIRDELLNTPAPTLLQGLDAMAFALHPELFPRAKGIRRITEVPPSTVANFTR